MLNAALNLYDENFEIIGGEKIMSPSPSVNHALISMRIAYIFMRAFIPKNNGYILAEIDVHFPDENLIKPDLTVIKFDNRKILNKKNAIYGVPDMTVEIFSRSTRKRDITIKKNIYEKNGVKEYWTVDPFAKTVEIFTLQDDGKFDDGAEYIFYEEDEWNDLTDEERENSPQEIISSIFENITVKLSDVFGWCI